MSLSKQYNKKKTWSSQARGHVCYQNKGQSTMTVCLSSLVELVQLFCFVYNPKPAFTVRQQACFFFFNTRAHNSLGMIKSCWGAASCRCEKLSANECKQWPNSLLFLPTTCSFYYTAVFTALICKSNAFFSSCLKKLKLIMYHQYIDYSHVASTFGAGSLPYYCCYAVLYHTWKSRQLRFKSRFGSHCCNATAPNMILLKKTKTK